MVGIITMTADETAYLHTLSRLAKAQNRVWRDHVTGCIATGISDPADFAMRLPLDIVEILVGATGQGASCRVHHSRVGELRSMGLVEFGGPFLTAFGMKVRRALMEDGR